MKFQKVCFNSACLHYNYNFQTKNLIILGFKVKAAYFLSSRRYNLHLVNETTGESFEVTKLAGLCLKQHLLKDSELNSAFFEEMVKKSISRKFRHVKRKPKKGLNPRSSYVACYTVSSQRIQSKRVVVNFKTHPYGRMRNVKGGKSKRSLRISKK